MGDYGRMLLRRRCWAKHRVESREGGRECQVGQGVPWAGTALDLLLQLGQTPLLHQLWVRLRVLGSVLGQISPGRSVCRCQRGSRGLALGSPQGLGPPPS